VIPGNVALQRRGYVRLVTTVENVQLLEVSEHCQRRFAVPSVTNGLKVIVCCCDVTVRFLGFDEEADIVVVWGDTEGVVCATFTGSRDRRLFLDFLLVGIGLLVMVRPTLTQ
jgi:hypothetical protein